MSSEAQWYVKPGCVARRGPLIMCVQGSSATVVTRSGDHFSGIFFGAELDGSDPSCLLKMVQQLKQGSKGSPDRTVDHTGDFLGSGSDFAMTFAFKDLIDICVENTAMGAKGKQPNGMHISVAIQGPC